MYFLILTFYLKSNVCDGIHLRPALIKHIDEMTLKFLNYNVASSVIILRLMVQLFCTSRSSCSSSISILPSLLNFSLFHFSSWPTTHDHLLKSLQLTSQTPHFVCVFICLKHSHNWPDGGI